MNAQAESPIALKYTYDAGGGNRVPIEVRCVSDGRYALLLGGRVACHIREYECKLAGGTYTQYKSEIIARTYYETLQDTTEAAVKKLRRTGKLNVTWD